PAHGDAPDLGEDQLAIIQPGAVAVLFVGEGVPAGAPLGAGEPRVFAGAQSPEERLRGLVQPGEHVVQPLGLEGGRGRECFATRLQLGLLLAACRPPALPAPPPGAALLEGGSGERATAPQDHFKLALLGGRRRELLLEGLGRSCARSPGLFAWLSSERALN